MQEAPKNRIQETFNAIIRLILGGLGLLGVSPLFPEMAKFCHLPSPPDPATGMLSIIVGFAFLVVACQDPDEKSEDSCDAAP